MIKIAITGPEATGKSSLANALAEYFDTKWCKEYSREYFANRSYEYDLNDVIVINNEQLERIASLTEENPKAEVLFYDTEACVNRIWAEKKFGYCPAEILRTTEKSAFDLYLLCYPDIEWEEDSLRENEHNREELFNSYKDILDNINAPYVVVRGFNNKRVQNALNLIFERFPKLKVQ